MNFLANLVIVPALAIAGAVKWLNLRLGGIFGGAGFVAYALLANATQSALRFAKMLQWMMLVSIPLLVVAVVYDVRPLLVMLCVVWAVPMVVLFIASRAIAQVSTRLAFMQIGAKIFARIACFFFWLAFMGLCGAFYVFPFSLMVATALFLAFLWALGVGRPVWAKRLALITAVLVFLTAVLPHLLAPFPLGSIPVVGPWLVAGKRFVVSSLGRATVETNAAARGVQPGVLENRDPDKFYISVRPSMIRNCFNCLDSQGNVLLSRVGVPAEITAGKWMAQVPEHPDVFVLNMRSYILVYRAWQNNPDGGFVTESMEMFFAPVDSVEEREISRPNNQSYVFFNQKSPKWIVGASVSGVVVLVLLALSVIAFRKLRSRTAPTPTPAPTQQPAHHP